MIVANTNESQEINNNNYESCVDSNDIAKKGALTMPKIDIEMQLNCTHFMGQYQRGGYKWGTQECIRPNK